MKKSFPFEYEAFIAGTAFLSRREKGCYIDLLCCQADKGHLTLQNIKDILNGDFDCWEKIKSKFTEENGLFYNKKLESVKKGKQKKTPEEIEIDRVKLETIINEKKLKLYNDLKPYLSKYPKEMLRQFYNYWTEKNKSGTKMRFELQQTFEIGKRLATWANREKEFNKTEPIQEIITYKELVDKFNKGDTAVWEQYEQIKVEGKDKPMWKLKKQMT